MIIYKITNKINGFIYIGKTSKSLNKRWKEHVYKATKKQENYIFYNAIRKYGACNFTLEIIDFACSNKELSRKEIYWIKFYNSKTPNGYNMTDGGEGIVGNKLTAEQKETLSKAHQGQKAWNKGLKMNSDFSKKMSVVNYRKWQNPNYRGKNHTNKGQKMHTNEHKQELSNHWKGIKNPRARACMCMENGAIYKTIKEASETLNISRPSITQCLLGHNKTARGLHFKYVVEVN